MEAMRGMLEEMNEVTRLMVPAIALLSPSHQLFLLEVLQGVVRSQTCCHCCCSSVSYGILLKTALHH